MAVTSPNTGTEGSVRALRIVARMVRSVARALSVLILAFTVVMFIGETLNGSGPFQVGEVSFRGLSRWSWCSSPGAGNCWGARWSSPARDWSPSSS